MKNKYFMFADDEFQEMFITQAKSLKKAIKDHKKYCLWDPAFYKALNKYPFECLSWFDSVKKWEIIRG
jgi:hypothetical protein